MDIDVTGRSKFMAISKLIGVYGAVTILALAAATARLHAADDQQAADAQPGTSPASTDAVKPYFSLSTNRTYGTTDRARVWINYQNIDHLDFRVYKVKDPFKFFKQLNDPHQMGEQEKTAVQATYHQGPTAIERLHSFKISILKSIKNYFRWQLHKESREAFNQKFHSDVRMPLNVADYARVPLLNPDQLVGSWREMLSPLENSYDSRIVTLGKTDPGVYLVEAVNGDLRAYSVAIVTDLSMLIKRSPDGGLLVYTVDRRTGAPRAGAQVEAVKGRQTLVAGATNQSGILQAQMKPEKKPNEPAEDEEGDEAEPSKVGRNSYLVMAGKSDQFAISDLEPVYYEGGEGEGDVEGESSGALTCYIYTDRPVYRAGQTAYFKAIVRRLGEGGYQIPAFHTVHVSIEDPDGSKVLDKEAPLSPRGTIADQFDIPAAGRLGSYRISVTAGGETQSGSDGYFEVQEYKKPEYKVTVSTAKPFVQDGEKTKFTIEAKYFFGSPVTGAEVKYYIYRSRYYYWWWANDDADDLGDQSSDDEDSGYYGYGNDMVKEGDGTLDSNGQLAVDFDVPQPEAKDAFDYTYRLEAQVTDASRRTIEAKNGFVGVLGNVVADAEPDRYVYYQGDGARLHVTTSDHEGHPLPADVTLKFIKRTWTKVEKETDDASHTKYFDYVLHEEDAGSASVKTSQQGDTYYNYRALAPGDYYIKAVVNDGKRQYESNGGWLWVADRTNKWADFSYENSEQIKLVPDKKSYQPGETAHVLAMLPFEKTHLLVTTELEGVMTARVMDAPGRAAVIDVPIDPRYSPNAYLSVCLVKDGDLYNQDHILSVPARDKFLKIDILTNKSEYKPRETASYTVLARKQDGQPAAGAELSLGVVDEAIYSISPDRAGDIRRAFYGRRYDSVQTSYSVSYSFSGYSGDKPVNLAKNLRKTYELADFKNDAQYVEPAVRKDFKDTAFWQQDLVTGADGKATVNVPLPDNLTTWRATVRAVTADTSVGSNIGRVIERKDLILRLETPRFMTKGDTVTLSGVVHNYLKQDKTAKVSIEVTGANLLSAPAQTVSIAKDGEQRIDWQVKATTVGQVKLLAKALTDEESDAVELPLEVVPGGLKYATGGTATIADQAGEKSMNLDMPGTADPQARYLRVEVAPSVAGSLFGALDYLTSYPYGCTEQTMSSFLPNIVVSQALKDVKGTSISQGNDLSVKVQRGMERLYDFQHPDGGWGWWKEDKTDPFMTAYVVDGLSMAGRAGYTVDQNRLDRGRNKLKQMIGATKLDNGLPIDPESRAYMVYALISSGGGSEANGLAELFANRGGLQPYGRALLALALKLHREDDRARQVAREIESTAQANDFDANWPSTRRPMLDFTERDDLEATALSIKALSDIEPASPVLAKGVRWLVNNRRYGYYWDSTRQTAFAILGLIDYVKVSHELSPDYNVEVYLNGQQVASKHITSADVGNATSLLIERKAGEVPLANQLRIVKQGPGMLYASASLSYYVGDEEPSPHSSPDLGLTREYMRLRVEGVEGEAKWTVEPLTGPIRSGDMLVVRLKLTGARGRFVMIEDPIPAGCEQVEQASGINLDYTDGKWSDWYSDREFWDQKTLLFVDYFSGSSTFQYALRVQVPGEFRAAPARAELMYAPTVQANTATAKMTILDKQGN